MILAASCDDQASQRSSTEENVTMWKKWLSAYVIGLALLTLAVSARAQQGKVLEPVKLTGAAEVPGPGDSKANGTAKLTLNPDKGEVCYELTVADLPDATAAHIHAGAVGKEGPVKVALDAPKTGSAKGCKNAD